MQAQDLAGEGKSKAGSPDTRQRRIAHLRGVNMTKNDREFQDMATDHLRELVRELDENRRRADSMHASAARALKRRLKLEREEND